MRGCRALLLSGLSLAFVCGSGGERAFGATPSFTITASNVTMSSSGTGSIPFTLTSVDGFAGTVSVSCGPANPPTGSILPQCNYTGSPIAQAGYTLNANATLTESVNLVAYIPPCSNPCPVKLLRRPAHWGAGSLALAGLVVFGLGLRRRGARWLTLTLIAFGSLAGLAGIGACGGNGKTLTAGTFAYTVTGYGEETSTGAQSVVNATVNVTVPGGVSTNLASANP